MESRLLALPCELRLQIYENVLICKSISFRIRRVKADAGDSRYNRRFRSKVSPALLRSCRQVHAEAIEILYSKNRFLTASATGLIEFLSKIKPNTRFLRWIKLRLGAVNIPIDNWTEAFRKLARRATRLERLDIAYVEELFGFEPYSVRYSVGNCPLTARVIANSIMEMHTLRKLVLSGYYREQWPGYFASKTNALIEVYAGVRVQGPKSGRDKEESYRVQVERENRYFKAYQKHADNWLVEDVTEEGPTLPGLMSDLTVSDSANEG